LKASPLAAWSGQSPPQHLPYRPVATTRDATARDATYNSVLDRRNTKITPCNADIAMQPARVGPIEAREDYPHISVY
jgi:hypothetical protein